MNEYQYSVSLHGKFVFRTDWETDMQRVAHTKVLLITAFPQHEGYKVTVSARSLQTTNTQVN